MPIAAFLFDMDGLLVDTEALHLGAFATVAQGCGLACRPQDLYRWVGKGQHRLSEWIAAEVDGAVTVDELLDRQRAEFFRLLAEVQPAPQPGVAALLEAAELEGLRVGLVSNSDRELVAATLAHVLRHLGRSADPLETFEVVVTRDDVAEAKPAPDPYLAAAAALGLDPAGCLAFEDSPSGAVAARAAGCSLVVVPCPYLPDPSEVTGPADVAYSSLAQAATERVWARL